LGISNNLANNFLYIQSIKTKGISAVIFSLNLYKKITFQY
jgi:hypothetical protein